MTPPSLAPVPGEPPQHPTDDLAALLTGDLDLTRTRAVTAHLRRCPACRDELVEVAAALGVRQALHRVDGGDARRAEVVAVLLALVLVDVAVHRGRRAWRLFDALAAPEPCRAHVDRVDLANFDLVERSRPRADLAIDLVTEH